MKSSAEILKSWTKAWMGMKADDGFGQKLNKFLEKYSAG
jgi:hypothetical protein